jgi:hypothetical protein
VEKVRRGAGGMTAANIGELDYETIKGYCLISKGNK